MLPIPKKVREGVHCQAHFPPLLQRQQQLWSSVGVSEEEEEVVSSVAAVAVVQSLVVQTKSAH